MPPEQHSQVRIRMYSQGLGDCFLLAFPRTPIGNPAADGRPVYVLIDCGVIAGTPGSSERMQQVVADIRETTADPLLRASDDAPKGHLDLLVITHEHWDHLSGFIYGDARAEWKHIEIDHVWMGWTAKHERDGLGQVLQEIKELQNQALSAIATQAKRFGVPERLASEMPGMGIDERLRTVLALNQFLMSADDAPDRSLASGLDFVKRLGGEACVYCEPGEVRPVPGTDAVAYVLGPPRVWKLLSKMNPSTNAPETYVNLFALADEAADDDAVGPHEDDVVRLRRMLDLPSPLTAFQAAIDSHHIADPDAPDETAAGKPPAELYYRNLPFDRAFRIPMGTAASQAASAPGDYPALDAYFDSTNQWRRIDTNYLMAAEAFALAANNFINNTSLVLAFELPPAPGSAERKVLLFAADAQVGNWLSWDEICAWTVHDGAKPSQADTRPDITDLLDRTVFYKVGHHGSHNATLKKRGVERMRSGGALTAFVPVSAPVAHNIGWTEIPLKPLLDALSERTGEQVVLPNGQVWSRVAGETVEEARRRIGVTLSPKTLAAKFTEVAGQPVELEPAVPMWVEIAVNN